MLLTPLMNSNWTESSDENSLIRSPHAFIKNTGTEKGRGVYANRSYKKGEVVEKCLVIIIDQSFQKLPEELKKIVFDWGVLAETHKRESAIALGFGSMYNHDDPANMKYQADLEQELLIFTTVREINKGEELTINYNAIGGGETWHDNNWFKRMKVTPNE